MAEPTMKDVLDAISRMQGDLARLDGKVDAYRAETKSDLAMVEGKVDAVRADVSAHRNETAKGFADLDRELTKHAEVHREIEKDIIALKARPARTAARPTRRR